MSWLRSLHVQVLLSIVIGIALGHFAPATGEAMKPLGDAFIKLIKMIIAPIIFCSIVTGIAGMDSMKKVGRVGGKALLYFEVVSIFALILGLAAVNLLAPGVASLVHGALPTRALEIASFHSFCASGMMLSWTSRSGKARSTISRKRP